MTTPVSEAPERLVAENVAHAILENLIKRGYGFQPVYGSAHKEFADLITPLLHPLGRALPAATDRDADIREAVMQAIFAEGSLTSEKGRAIAEFVISSLKSKTESGE